jgi:hypothetical protein
MFLYAEDFSRENKTSETIAEFLLQSIHLIANPHAKEFKKFLSPILVLWF